jgi:hypothetical protein
MRRQDTLASAARRRVRARRCSDASIETAVRSQGSQDRTAARIVFKKRKGPSVSQNHLSLLKAERNKLWAEVRLKGLPVGTPQRDRIAELDEQIRAQQETTKRPV